MPTGVEHNQVANINILQIEPKLDRIPKEFFSLFPSVEYFTVQSKIKEISTKDFMNATKLIYLGLEGNGLQKLTAGTFRLVNLKMLELSNNQIETIDDFTFANQTSLSHLHMRGNKLTTIRRDTFSGLKHLNELNLNNNEIDTIENGAFANLSELHDLYLNRNKLKVLNDHVFDGLTALKLLWIAYNQLENVGNCLWTLTSIEEINLGYNNITDIDLAKFKTLPRLNRLDLRGVPVGNVDTKGDLKIIFDGPSNY